MPRIVPSAVVTFIDTVFSASMLGRGNAGQLSALVDMVDSVPAELLAMDGPTYAEFLCGVGEIREALKRWAADRSSRDHLDPVPGFNGATPTRLIRKAMEKCPDEAPTSSVASLTFLTDPEFRESLRTDIGTVHRALSNGEWKAATVLAGSATEALLLWILKLRPPSEVQSSANILHSNGTFSDKPPTNLEKWTLHHYIEVAEALKLISDKTAIQCLLAKDYRNLIHPGRAERFGIKPNIGTAFSAVAGLEHVIIDLMR